MNTTKFSPTIDRLSRDFTENLRQAFDTFEIGVFNSHDTFLREQLIGVIVDQLSR